MVDDISGSVAGKKIIELNEKFFFEKRRREVRINNEFNALLHRFSSGASEFNAQCDLMFKNLREKLDKKYHIKLNKLERKIRRAAKPLFFQPSEEKNTAFKKQYLEILAEGETVFNDEQNLWGDYIRPALVDFANFFIKWVQFALSAFIPSLRNYEGAFFEKPSRQTREDASNIWKCVVESSEDKFYEIANHAVTLG